MIISKREISKISFYDTEKISKKRIYHKKKIIKRNFFGKPVKYKSYYYYNNIYFNAESNSDSKKDINKLVEIISNHDNKEYIVKTYTGDEIYLYLKPHISINTYNNGQIDICNDDIKKLRNIYDNIIKMLNNEKEFINISLIENDNNQ